MNGEIKTLLRGRLESDVEDNPPEVDVVEREEPSSWLSIYNDLMTRLDKLSEDNQPHAKTPTPR